MSSLFKKKISIITVCYNIKNEIARTCESIVKQTLQDFEWIVIDGGSTDGTLEILEKYKNRIDIFISEKDEGVYNAMNKGILKSSGEYLNFMNGGDEFFDVHVLATVFSCLNGDDIYYGDSYLIEVKGNIVHKQDPTKLCRAFFILDCLSHQSSFIKKILFQKYDLYNIKYKIISDLEKWLIFLNNNCSFKKIDCVVSKFYQGGISANAKILKSERALYLLQYFSQEEIIDAHLNQRLGAVSKILSQRVSVSQQINQKPIEPNLMNKKQFKHAMQCIFSVQKDSSGKKYIKFFGVTIFFSKKSKNKKTMTKDNKFKSVFKSIFSIRKDSAGNKIMIFFGIRILLHTSKQSFAIDRKDLQKIYMFERFIREFNTATTGLQSSKKEAQLIVSLTSFPERLYNIHYCLFSILNQSIKSNKIILWLAEEQFPNKENDLPKDVLNFKNNGLTIQWCKDLKSYKKLIPTLKQYPNDVIITLDDDIFYPRDTLEILYNEYLKMPNCIHANRGSVVKFSDMHKGKIEPYHDWDRTVRINHPSYKNFFEGVGGVLYPIRAFDEEVFCEDTFMKLAPTADDVWFWAMAIKNGTKINIVRDKFDCLDVSPQRAQGLTNELTLWSINKFKNDEQVSNVLDYYHLKDRLYKDE